MRFHHSSSVAVDRLNFRKMSKLLHLKYVGTALSGHGNAESKEEDAHEGGEDPTTGPQEAGKHVDQASDKAFHDAELTVYANDLESWNRTWAVEACFRAKCLRTTSMTKKVTAQTGPPGNLRTTAG